MHSQGCQVCGKALHGAPRPVIMDTDGFYYHSCAGERSAARRTSTKKPGSGRWRRLTPRSGTGDRRLGPLVPIWEPTQTASPLRRWQPAVPYWTRDP
jgi:hypothetical protein